MYLLQQEDPLGVFGQVVCSKAALDACSNHNSIPEICLSSHDATKPTEEKANKGTSRLEGEEEGKVQRSYSPHNPLGPMSLSFFSSPKSLAQGAASASPCRAELGRLICEVSPSSAASFTLVSL